MTQPELDALLQQSLLGDTPRSFIDEESSLVDGASYDPEALELLVDLKAGGGIKSYVYGGVPIATYIEFYQATSRGQYFNRYIRPMFAGHLV